MKLKFSYAQRAYILRVAANTPSRTHLLKLTHLPTRALPSMYDTAQYKRAAAA